ncbi:MAG: sodium:solute symporter [Cyanobacteriota bacterium]
MEQGIQPLDWIVIIVYIGFLLYLGFYLGSKQKSTEEYFVGSRSLTWPIIGISAMATQLSAISFISAPGFVGLKEQGGGTLWLGAEFAVPIAMLILIMVVYPVFYNAKIVTIYEYLNTRFDSSTRLAISLVFQISRILATGISIYATAIVFQAAFNIHYLLTILIVSVVTIIYAATGGIKAVIYADVVQMVIIFIGIFFCAFYALNLMGGWEIFVDHLDRARLNAVDFAEWGYKGKHEYGFWPMVLGGLFLYLSYYGCDQTQSQRLISSKDMKNLNLSLLFNGLARFPMVLAYCMMGLIVGVFAFMTPEFMNEIPLAANGNPRPDFMLPTFIVHYLPAGIVGLLLVAVLSAAMSSISGTLNSLSAATMKDVVIPYFKKDMKDDQAYKLSLLFTVIWGVLCTIIALVGDKFAETAIEAINKVGSLFYGSILAVFLLGMVTKKTNAFSVKLGLILGVLFNAYLWLNVPELSWLWWNLTGFAVTALIAYITSLLTRYIDKNDFDKQTAFMWGFIIPSVWGIICFLLYASSDVVAADTINLITTSGSLIFGSIVGIFIFTTCLDKKTFVYALFGLTIGLLINIALWYITKGNQWVLWLSVAAILAIISGYIVLLSGRPVEKEVEVGLLSTKIKILQPGIAYYSTILIGFFVVIILFSICLKYMF